MNIIKIVVMVLLAFVEIVIVYDLSAKLCKYIKKRHKKASLEEMVDREIDIIMTRNDELLKKLAK